MILALLVLLCFSLLRVPGVAAQTINSAPDRAEPGSSEAIAQYTTEPRFLSPWVAYVPASDKAPSPTQYLGHVVGAPGELTRPAKIQGYVRALAAATARVRVETIGKTEEGREIVLVVIADEAGIRDLARLKAATAALADPRHTSPEQAESLITTARPVYYFNCNLHADETGSGEMCMELVYRLAVSEQPMIQAIRQNVLVLINPVAEPDGREKVADWFYRYLKGKTDYDALPRQSPPYWNRYVYVDINRDAHQKAFAVTRAVHKMFYDYHPTVVHDLHEGIPFMLTWNGTGPYNPNMDPIVFTSWLEMSFHEMTAMTGMGMPGVWTWKFGDGFGHHYLDSVAMNHNAIGRGYETFGNATAETVTRTTGSDDTTAEWYRPSPPERTFRWSMRDNTNYQETGCLSILDWAAKNGKEMLRDFYRTGYNSWRKGIDEKPYAYVIPDDQPDRLRVAQMVNRLRDQHIEVARLTGDIALNEGKFARGSYVVKLDQPYRNYAVDLLEPQRFPAEAENLPYDDVSWAFPMGFGVNTVRIEDERVKTAPAELLTADAAPTGTVKDVGPVFLLRDQGQEALLAARFRLAKYKVEIAEKSFAAGGVNYPAGSWMVSSKGESAQQKMSESLAAASRELALDFESAAAAPDVPRHEAILPRIGVWVPWADTDMMGWVRLVLDREQVPYTYLRDEDVRAGGLKNKVDVIIYGPFSRLGLSGQIHGIAATNGPIAFTRTAEFPSHGAPVASEDITGGPGYIGLEAIRKFADDGGVLLTLGMGSTLALEGGLVRNVERTHGSKVFTPGSQLRATFTRPDHPIAYGYAAETSVFRTNTPVYDVPRRWVTMAYCTSCLDGPEDARPVVLSWGGKGPMVVSGGMRGEAELAGHPAILDVPTGRGHIVTYNFNAIHRDMNRANYRLLWNAILNWNSLPTR